MSGVFRFTALDRGPSVGLALALIFTGMVAGAAVIHPRVSAYAMRTQSDYEFISVEVNVAIEDRDSPPTNWTTRKVVRSLTEGLKEIELFHGYGTNAKAVQVTVKQGGVQKEIRQGNDGHHYIVVELTSPLEKGESALIVYEHNASNAGPCPRYLRVSPTHPMQNISLQIHFTQPDYVFGVYSCFWLSQNSPKACSQKVLHIDRSGVVKYNKRRTKPGHSYGMVWEWRDRDDVAPNEPN